LEASALGSLIAACPTWKRRGERVVYVANVAESCGAA